MYSIIQQIIDHNWISQNAPGDQTYVYYVCCVLISVLLVTLIDLVYRVIYSVVSFGKKINKEV